MRMHATVRWDRRVRQGLVAIAVIVAGQAVQPGSALACVGDCDGDGTVTVSELVTAVNIALGLAPLNTCTAVDTNGDGMVTINELVAAVTGALIECAGGPTITLTGSCAAPGGHSNHGLESCAAGTPISVFRCDDRGQCLHQQGLTMIASGTVADNGGWAVQIAPANASAALVFQASIANAVVYRALGFGSVGGLLRIGAGRAASYPPIDITPVTEAGVDLLDMNGFGNYSDAAAQQVLNAITQATSSLDFENVAPDMAAATAVQTASQDPTVMMVLQTVRNTPTPTGTFTRTPTASHTSTQTATSTATPTLPTPPANFIVAGDVSGSPGASVQLSVSLRARARIQGVQNDITFVSGVFGIDASDGKPDCSVNPDIQKDGTTFEFLPPGCASGSTCTGIRATVLSFANLYPIADASVLYTCVISIRANANVGDYPLVISNPLASDPNGEFVSIAAQDGTVHVSLAGAPTATPTVTPTVTPTSPPTNTPTATPTAPAGRFVDNNDGTITDTQTALIWEKKVALDSTSDFANLHDADDSYAWAGNCTVNTDKLCQPSAAASTACTAGVEGDATGCAQCVGSDGSCNATDTIWTWVLALNAATFAGHADWRVPTITELESIVDYTVGTSPAVKVPFQGASCGGACTDVTEPACSCTQSDVYWSSATYQFAGGFIAWYAFFRDGYVNVSAKSSLLYVRAVRGGAAAPVPRYVDNGDGAITDMQTSLIWEKKVALDNTPDLANLHDADDSYAWAGTCSLSGLECQPSAAASAACMAGVEGDATACAQCAAGDGNCNVTDTIWTWVSALNAANFAGHADWRVPKIAELESIVDYTLFTIPPVDAAFQGASCGATCTDLTDAACSCTSSTSYWPSTTYKVDPSSAWVVQNGTVFGPSNKAGILPVRAVRAGP